MADNAAEMNDIQLMDEHEKCLKVLDGTPDLDGLRSRKIHKRFTSQSKFHEALEFWEERLRAAEDEMVARFILS